MANDISRKLVALTLGSVFVGSVANARVALNTSCELKEGSTRISGVNTDKKYPLASISKVITSLWAIEKLGVDHRFQTVIHINPTSKQGAYDIHIEGSRDPMFGRNMGYFLISELNRKGIKEIDRLTYDENFLLAWLAEERPLIGGNTPNITPSIVAQTIKSSLGTAVSLSHYRNLAATAKAQGISMVLNPSIRINNITHVNSKDVKYRSYKNAFSLKSAPLRQILKRMNNQSNNYVADYIFKNLGGPAGFTAYAKTALGASSADFTIYNGSGNNEGSTSKPIYNTSTCEFMIKTLVRLDDLLEKKGYDLSHVMAVASRDRDSTVKNYNGLFTGSVVAKTGSVNKGKTLAGAINTMDGQVYFTIMMHTDQDLNRSDWGNANNIIKDRLSRMINKYNGAKAFNYKQLPTLPFDSKSGLVEISKLPNGLARP